MDSGPPPIFLASGTWLSRFLVLDPLEGMVGRCQGASTWLGLDRERRDLVALVTVPAHGWSEERFLAECEAIRASVSPHLQRLVAAGESEGHLFAAWTWVAGIDLPRILLGGALPPAAAARSAAGLVASVADLHARGLLHGNLAPENVVFGPDGEIRLLGFVPSGRIGPGPGAEPEAAARFRAPEDAPGSLPTPRSEVFSLAAIVHALLSGRTLLPKGGAEERRRFLQALASEPACQAEAMAGVPSPVVGALLAALHPDPARRPASAVELAGSVGPKLGTGTGAPAATGLLPRLVLPARDHRTHLLRTARSALEGGSSLPAAARLAVMARLSPQPAEAVEMARLLEGCLWTTFDPCPDEAGRRARVGLCLLVLDAASRAQAQDLAVLARRRLARFVAPGSDVAELLVPEPTLEAAAQIRTRLTRVVASDAGRTDALLGIACLDPGLVRSTHTPLPLFLADLCRRQGLPGVALHHAAREATSEGVARALLPILGELLAALQGEDPAEVPSPPSAPPPGDGAQGRDRVEPARPPAATASPLASEAPRGPPGLDPGPAAKPRDPGLEDGLVAVADELEGGRLGAAVEGLADLAGRGAFEDPETFPVVTQLVWDALWLALVPGPLTLRRDRALEALLPVLRDKGPLEAVPLCERVLVAILPEDEGPERVDALLARYPDSIPLLQVASRRAAQRGEDRAWASILATAGETFLAQGEPSLAARMFMAVKAIEPDHPAAASGMQGVFELGERLVQDGARFRAVEARIQASEFVGEALIHCRGFLAMHPHFLPALERTAELHVSDGNRTEAARLYLELARRCLLRDEERAAVGYLHKVLTHDLDNPEAMLWLATRERLPVDAPRQVKKLKVWILEREGLEEAVRHQLSQWLSGGPEDFATLTALVASSRRSGKDPSAYLAAQGKLALRQGEARLARDCLLSALESAEDRPRLVQELIEIPEVRGLLPASALLGN